MPSYDGFIKLFKTTNSVSSDSDYDPALINFNISYNASIHYTVHGNLDELNSYVSTLSDKNQFTISNEITDSVAFNVHQWLISNYETIPEDYRDLPLPNIGYYWFPDTGNIQLPYSGNNETVALYRGYKRSTSFSHFDVVITSTESITFAYRAYYICPIGVFKIGNSLYFVTGYSNTASSWTQYQTLQFTRLFGWENLAIHSIPIDPDSIEDFILKSPDDSNIYLPVGDSVELKFAVISNGEEYPITNVIYDGLGRDLYWKIESTNKLTAIGNYPFPPAIITIFPNIPDYADSGHAIVINLYTSSVPPYAPNGSSRPSGGGGYYGDGYSEYPTANKIPVGTTEANDSATGMYTRYLVDVGMLGTMADWLWSEELGLQVAKAIISLIYGDPIQTIISCVSYPFQLTGLVGEIGTTLHWGGHDTTISMSRTAKNAFQINWGSITIKEHWGNFLDYSPHTQMQLYLPWGTGFVPIDPNDILNTDGAFKGTGVLSIVTNVEISRGMCVHHVIANNTVIGSYSGACGRQIAMVGNDYASKQVALAGSAIGAMAAATLTGGKALSQSRNVEVSKNPNGQFIGYEHGGVKRMQDKKGNYHDKATGRFTTKPEQVRYDVKTGKDAINKAELQKLAAKASAPAIACAAAAGFSPANVVRSGSFQEGTGGMTIQSPYLIISIPKMDLPDNYGHYYGYPSNITFKIGSLSGYTEVASIHLDGFNCTMSELDEIESLLTGGVIL